jgi:hypothetical protein
VLIRRNRLLFPAGGAVAAPFGAYVTHQLPDRALMILVGIVNMLLTRELRHWLTLVLRV